MKKLKFILPLILILALIFSANCFATAWDASSASYEDKYKDVSAQDGISDDVTFSSDGSKMYIMGSGNDTVYQYSLSTPWDMSTASYADKSKYVRDEDRNPQDVTFSSDGSKMYIMGEYTNAVYQYTLSTSWDVSTASYAEKYKSVSGQEVKPFSVYFKPDGLKMYIVGDWTDTVYQYSLSTSWDVGTAFYEDKSKDVSSQDTYPNGLFFSSDGSKMYVAGGTYNKGRVYQYILSTPWDVSTASYDSKFADVNTEEKYVRGVFLKDDGLKMYIVGDWTDTVYQYSLLGPSAPTNVDATDGINIDKVVITWTKSAGATDYQVYRDGVGLGWLGDVATHDDTGADAPTITAGTASASDATSTYHVTLSIVDESANNGTNHTYKVKAKDAEGESSYSEFNNGYRGEVGALTYQWQRSAGDSDADYSNIDGATTNPYNDTGAPENGDGRYYKCVLNATGAIQQTTNSDRGYRAIYIETLRPSAAGDETLIPDQFPDSTFHWDKVDEVDADDLSTYVYYAVTDGYGDFYDLYALPDPDLLGVIKSVKVYIRVAQDFGYNLAYTKIKTHDTEYTGSEYGIPPGREWGITSETYTENPNTTNDWTWAEINALQIGVRLKTSDPFYVATKVYCTQVYVGINYIPHKWNTKKISKWNAQDIVKWNELEVRW